MNYLLVCLINLLLVCLFACLLSVGSPSNGQAGSEAKKPRGNVSKDKQAVGQGQGVSRRMGANVKSDLKQNALGSDHMIAIDSDQNSDGNDSTPPASGSQSPTSRALVWLRASLAQLQAVQTNPSSSLSVVASGSLSVRESTSRSQAPRDEFEQVPLQMLPYFKFLNDQAQRYVVCSYSK